MMNKLIFNDISYNVAENGISISNDSLVTKLVTDDFDEVESTVAPVDEIIQTLDDGTKISVYKGYTKLISLDKRFNQVVDHKEISHEETRPKVDPETGEYIIDPETGEIETETVVVTDYEPVYADIIVVTLFQPTLEDTVADQGEQITEIQEVLAEII